MRKIEGAASCWRGCLNLCNSVSVAATEMRATLAWPPQASHHAGVVAAQLCSARDRAEDHQSECVARSSTRLASGVYGFARF